MPVFLPLFVMADKGVYHKRTIRKSQTIFLAQNSVLYHDIIRLLGFKTKKHTACLLNTDLDRYQVIDASKRNRNSIFDVPNNGETCAAKPKTVPFAHVRQRNGHNWDHDGSCVTSLCN